MVGNEMGNEKIMHGVIERWIWLDPTKHPDLQRCEARRIQGGGLPAGQRGFAMVEFRGRVALPSPAAGPLRLHVSADTAYRLRLNGTDLAAGPAPAPGDWLPLPRLAAWYADAIEASVAPVLDFEATVRLGEARLCETSAGHGGFLLAGEVALQFVSLVLVEVRCFHGLGQLVVDVGIVDLQDVRAVLVE